MSRTRVQHVVRSVVLPVVAALALLVGVLAAAPAHTVSAGAVETQVSPVGAVKQYTAVRVASDHHMEAVPSAASGTERAASKWALRFAKRWAKAATARNWKWIRKHSVMGGSGVRIEDIKWFLGEVGKVRFGTCGDSYSGKANRRLCWGANAANLEVKRSKKASQPPGPVRMAGGRRIVALSFWVED